VVFLLVGEEFFGVFGEEVGFEVDELAGFGGLEVGDLDGMGDDPEDGGGWGEVGDGEGDAVDGEGSFVDAVFVDVGGEGDFEAVVLAAWGEVEDPAGGVDVALDEVAAEASVGGEGAFEVGEAAGGEFAEGGDFEGLGEEVEGGVAAIEGGDREAASVDGDGFAHGELSGEGNGEGESGLFATAFEGMDLSDGFYQTSEHEGVTG